MERCHSNSSLPQGFYETAKYNLVKIPCSSKSEIKIFVSEDCLAMGDQDFKSKRRKPNPLWKSIQDLCLKADFVAPSTDIDGKRKCSRVSSQDDLWASILPDYTFLMADDLITECKETREELSLPLPQFPSSKATSVEIPDTHQMLSYKEFLDYFNKLHDTLHSLQTSADQISETKYKDLLSECQYLKEQASVLKLMNPELVEPVNLRSAILKNKLQLIEQRLFPKRAHEKDMIIKSLKSQMKEIRKWLQEMEGKLRKLKINDNCATEEIDEVFSQEKILQREIEGRGKELTTIVRQCNSLEGAAVAESKKLRRAAAHLERSWHNIWIRSLEKQCLTEQRLLERQTYENNHRESSDLELDEGPLNKHRRLSLDRWTAVASTPSMDRTRADRDTLKSNDVIKNGLTKDVGILCSDMIPVNDKCIMVGTTGIAALKAEYGDDFTNFEIIQDVGYSSESSTHLSSDDGFGIGSDRYYNIRVYNYSNKTPTKCTSLKEELEDADSRQPQSLSSSLGSSGATSFNDSGIGASDLLSVNSSAGDKTADPLEVPAGDKTPFEGLSRDLCESFVRDVLGEESDYLETVLESCANFCVSDGEKGAKGDSNVGEDLQYVLSGIESDDSSDNFHNRSSFTTSSQLFYKMISVESENDEGETRMNESSYTSVKTIVESKPSNEFETSLDSSHLSKTLTDLTPPKDSSHQDPNLNIEQPIFDFTCLNDNKPFHKSQSKEPNDRRSPVKNATPNLKRKRDSEPADFAPATWQGGGRAPHRVRAWLKRTSYHTDPSQLSRVRRNLFQGNSDQSSCEESVPNLRPFKEDISSCDASGEYTSSSADEGNAHSSSSYDDDERRLRLEGSVETVLSGFGGTPRRCSDVDWLELSPVLLPPPLSSTPACLRKGHCKAGKSYHPLSGSHCGDMKWLVLKASSEGDLRRRGNLSGSNHSLANIPTDIRRKKGMYDSPSLEYKHRMCSSLPNVLRHRSDSSAEDMKTSQSESKSSRRCNGHDESFTSVVSHNQSSSSDLEKRKKRRYRRKSSSSNRSSRSVLTSCDTNRSRTRTLTGSIGSRRRHFSQKSDFFEDSENDIEPGGEGPLLEETKCPIEEINHKTLKDELQLALAESCRNSSALLSPTESDVVLTHLEEQSTVSDQVWDNYQDMPYLSEAYSEATVDEDAVRKLTEFGDDYGSAIGQPLRYQDTVDSGKVKTDNQKSPSKKSSKAFPTLVQSIDSDSDIEDLHHVIEEAEKALYFARATLKRRQSGDFFSSTENAELLATCGTYLHYLQTICEFIEIDGNDGNFSSNDLKELHGLIEEWNDLKKSIEMYEDVDDTISQKYDKARKSIDDLYTKISELSVLTEMDVKDCLTWEHLQESISKLQMVMCTLQDTKEMLLAVNLQVHRFSTEYGDCHEYKDSSLKDDVTELYQKWEDVYEKNGAQLTELETLSNRWKQYKDKLRVFKSKVEDMHCISSNEDEPCDKNKSSCKELLKTLQMNLEDLKRSADLIRSSSIGAPLWKSVKLELKDLEQRIKKETRTLSVSRKKSYPNSSADEDDPDDDFEDAIQKMEKDHLDNTFSSPNSSKHDSDLAKKSSSRFWRIIRVAVPVQLTLVLLFCLACYLEPNCCDRMNNFNFSFTPHLRYLGGPPPV